MTKTSQPRLVLLYAIDDYTERQLMQAKVICVLLDRGDLYLLEEPEP